MSLVHLKTVPLADALSRCRWAVLVRNVRREKLEDYTVRKTVGLELKSNIPYSPTWPAARRAENIASAFKRWFGATPGGVPLQAGRGGPPALLARPERRPEDPGDLGPHEVRGRMGRGRLGSLYLLESGGVVRVLSPEAGAAARQQQLPDLEEHEDGRLLLLRLGNVELLEACLHGVLERFPSLPVGWVLLIFLGLLKELDELHARGAAHGGLTADTVFLGDGYVSLRVCLIDCGLEQRLTNGAATPRDDLRALGVLLCEMLGGRPPSAELPTSGDLWAIGLRLQRADGYASVLDVVQHVYEQGVRAEKPFEYTIPLHPFVVEKVLLGDPSRLRPGERVECLSSDRLKVLELSLKEASTGASVSFSEYRLDAKGPAPEDSQLILLLDRYDRTHQKYLIGHFLSHELQEQVAATPPPRQVIRAPRPQAQPQARPQPQPRPELPRSPVRTALGLLALVLGLLQALALCAKLVRGATLLDVTAGLGVTALCLAVGALLVSRPRSR